MTPDELHVRLRELARAPIDPDLEERVENRVHAALRRVANDPAEARRVRNVMRSIDTEDSRDAVFGDESVTDLVADDFDDVDDSEEIRSLRSEVERRGADHALALANAMPLTEADARSLVEEKDRPSALDDWPWPDWSAESATLPALPVLLTELLGLVPDVSEEWITAAEETMVLAWQSAARTTYRDALDALAFRLLGRLEQALELERLLHQRSI